jgi:hypothetical protein
VTDHPPGTDRDHLSPDALADLQEGLLDEPAARLAEEHLRVCRRCLERQDALAEVSALLADAGGTAPVPDDVAARLAAALAAEPSATAAATVTPLGTARRPSRGMRVLQAAAVLVLLLAGAGLAVTAVQGGGSQNQASDTAGGAVAEKAVPQDPGDFPVTASGRNWSADTLAEEAPRLVAGTLGPAASAAQDSGGSGDSGAAAERELADSRVARLAGGPDLAGCVTALAAGPVTPVAVDLASWQGQPAAVVVLPTPDDPATVDIWVVAPECAEADAKVLYFARVARP